MRERLRNPEDLKKLRQALQGERDPNKRRITICAGTGCGAYGCGEIISAFKEELTSEVRERREALRQLLRKGMSPKEVADCVFQAISEDQFYIFTHPEWKVSVKNRMENILEGFAPENPFAQGVPTK